MYRGQYAADLQRVDASSTDAIELSIRTASGDVLKRTTAPETWGNIKEDGPTLFACADHDEIADETGRYYPGYALRCPVCDAMMERIDIIDQVL